MSDSAREEHTAAFEPSGYATRQSSVPPALRPNRRVRTQENPIYYFDCRSGARPNRRAAGALPKWRLMRVLAYIETNTGKPITLANLAATAGLSRMYFARQFRATTGIRPHDFVLHKRIEHAQQKLAATSDALVDIALSVGFQTQAHFTTVFKKIAGNTPYKWRRERLPLLRVRGTPALRRHRFTCKNGARAGGRARGSLI